MGIFWGALEVLGQFLLCASAPTKLPPIAMGGLRGVESTPMATRESLSRQHNLDRHHPPQRRRCRRPPRRFPAFHPLNLEDIVSPIERPKLDQDDDYLFLVMHFPLWDSRDELSRPSEVDFFLGRRLCRHRAQRRAQAPGQLPSSAARPTPRRADELLGQGANHLLHALIDQLVDYIFPILNKVDRRVHAIEDALFESDAKRVIQELAFLRRDIISLRRIIRGQIPIILQLETCDHPILHEHMEEYFGDIADHLFKLRDIADENFEIINSFADTADTLASYRINEVHAHPHCHLGHHAAANADLQHLWHEHQSALRR